MQAMRLIGVAGVLALLGGAPSPWGATATDDLLWRNLPASGANALHLATHIVDRPVDYATLGDLIRSHPAPHSPLALRDAARRCGFSSSVCKLAPDDLTPENLPLIALTDDRTGQGSAYVMVVKRQGAVVSLVDTGPMTFHEVRIDQFRRRWTGYAVLLKPVTSGTRVLYGISLLLVLASCGCVAASFRRRPSIVGALS